MLLKATLIVLQTDMSIIVGFTTTTTTTTVRLYDW